jgi:hypothetical protein
VKITATVACALAIAAIVTLSAPAEARIAVNGSAANQLATNKRAANHVASRQPTWPSVAGDAAFAGVKEIALPNGVRVTR